MAVQEANVEATLTDETLQELGLSEQPFLDDKKRQTFTDSTTQKTRAALEQHLRFGDSVHLLIGEEGAGKTVLLTQLINHCKSSIKPFVVRGADEFQTEAFLAAVLYQLNNEEEAESVEEHIEKLEPLFEQLNNEQYSAVLVVDDAHLAPLEEIAELVDIIGQFENDEGRTARLLLTGTPALTKKFSEIESQIESLNLTYSKNIIPPMDENRTREYLSSRLHQVGFTDAFPFTDKAISKLNRDAQGLPRQINTHASQYLNGVYQKASGTGKGGLLAGLDWPVIGMGVAALGVIGWGISQFFGDKPDTQVIPVAQVQESQVQETSDVIASGDITQDTQIITPENTDEPTSEPIVATTSVTTPVETPPGDSRLVPPTQSTDLVLPEPVAANPEEAVDTASTVIEVPLGQGSTFTSSPQEVAEILQQPQEEPLQGAAQETSSSDLFTVPQSPGLADDTIDKNICLLYTSPSPRDATLSRMPSSA